jgi:5-methylcytosine-specific restriction endonuclease McrA
MTVSDLTKEVLYDLYMNQKMSPEKIGEEVSCTGRNIRYKLRRFGILALGPGHLRKGKSATWCVGVKRSPETNEKNRLAHLGTIPPNKGVGSVGFVCEVCGKEVFDKPYRRKRTCSKACKDRLSALHRGEDHWNYKGDEAGYVQRKRLWAEYKEWRRDVLKRDNYTCQKCQKYGGRLTAHHLNNWAEYPDQRFDLDNGVTLCWSCHWTFHRTYGHKHTTKEMFLEWLTTSNAQHDATY